LEVNRSYTSETQQLAVQLVITRGNSSTFKNINMLRRLNKLDKSLQTDGKAKLNAGCESFNLYTVVLIITLASSNLSNVQVYKQTLLVMSLLDQLCLRGASWSNTKL